MRAMSNRSVSRCSTDRSRCVDPPLAGRHRAAAGCVDHDRVTRLILKSAALQAHGNQRWLGCFYRTVESASHSRSNNADDLVEGRCRLGLFAARLSPAHRKLAHRYFVGDLVGADRLWCSRFLLSLAGHLLPELLGCQQSLQPAQFLITQPTRGRRTRDQQRDAIRPHVQDVLPAVDATRLPHDEVAERLGWGGSWTNERTSSRAQQGCCREHSSRSSGKPRSIHHDTMTNRQPAKVPEAGLGRAASVGSRPRACRHSARSSGLQRAAFDAYFLINDRSTYCMMPPLR